VNVLLDTDGPGCIHRIFTGLHMDLSMRALLEPGYSCSSIIIRNLSGIWKSLNSLMITPGHFHILCFPENLSRDPVPIPFAEHCKIQLVNEGRLTGEITGR